MDFSMKGGVSSSTARRFPFLHCSKLNEHDYLGSRKDVCDGEIGLSKLIIMLIYIVWGQLPAKKLSKNVDRTSPPWRNS